ncbi:MAG: 2-oxoglutarate dehydrogenase complex dihydrolipoyllysine-residue succinyltransferase [Proteobacteria bacterium]|nr:2-oxoglutarate dehydrogenase complex dihydrolipoyllysine-residue succinyltransferase [Pseudomonadota bacterium]
MTIEIKVPQLPESVTDATLVGWHKKVGESVRRDDNRVDLETDKVVLEVPAPASGTLIEIKVSDGTTVTSGELLALLDESAAPAAVERQQAEVPAPTAATAEAAQKLSPAVRRILDEHDLDATIVTGTGKDGRITKSDVMAYLKSHSDEDVTPGDPAPALPAAGAQRTEQRVPMTRLRARIAARMVEAQHAAAMLTTFNEVDLTKVMSLRKRYKESFEKEHGVRLGFMSFFAKAAVEALKKYPAVNASVEDEDIIYHDYFDIGIAVSSDRGLMVPVLRNVDHLSFAQIESDIAALGKKARDGTMSMEDLTGGTFTITNGGVFGSMLSTPILNPPQSAILGMHAIQQRPMVVDGEIVVRPMMYLALTYDHRIIDGKEAVQFLVNLKNSLEDPGRLLLQV